MDGKLQMKLDIGRTLRVAREEKKLSLRSVASAVGVSPSLLSQVETGKAQPSVGTLYALVNHLGLSLDAMMRGDTEAAPAIAAPTLPAPTASAPSYDAAMRGNTVQRAGENPIIEMQNGVTWERLAVGGYSFVDPLLVTYAPGASSGIDDKLMRHAGIEFGYILEGELTLQLEFDTFTIGEGDSFCFSSERPHLFVNRSTAPAKGMWFVVGRREPAATDGNAPLDALALLDVLRNNGITLA
ncbi:helix-turn-helix domain-containing protein [Microbacterium sp. NPDC058389]|uniref:helix-turn-helix domain-containing protein n=1 Tax=Microbacterium sp. NPDC058389 TaxID=3346475 RepID=UPI00365A45F7